MRKNTVSHSNEGYAYRVTEVSRWRHFVAASVETVLAAVGHPCCRWGWAYKMLCGAVNYEHKAETLLISIPLTREQAAALAPDFVTHNDELELDD